MNANRHEIVEECLELLRLGTSLEECLTRYPDDAEELEPILRTAVSTRSDLALDLPPATRARSGNVRMRSASGAQALEYAHSFAVPQFGAVPEFGSVPQFGALSQMGVRGYIIGTGLGAWWPGNQ